MLVAIREHYQQKLPTRPHAFLILQVTAKRREAASFTLALTSVVLRSLRAVSNTVDDGV